MAKNKKNVQSFDKWKNLVSRMNTYMKNAETTKGYERFKKYYKGDYEGALGLKRPLKIVRVNEVYAYVRTCVSQLFARNPKFKCNPRTKEDILPGIIAENAINYEWYIKNIKHQSKKAIKEAKVVGYSWVKVGYNADIAEYDENEVAGEVNQYIKSEEVYAVHVKHNHIVYDPEAQDPPFDARWMYHKYLKPTEFLKEKYGLDIKPTASVDYLEDEKSKSGKNLDRSWVYEIWDKDSGCVYFYCDGYDKDFLEVKKPEKDGCMGPYHINGFPFIMLSFDTYVDLDDKDNLPMPEIAAFEDQILEKMRYRSIVAEHVKRFSRQIFASSDAFKTSADKDKFIEGIVAAVIETNGNPGDKLWSPPAPTASIDIWPLENKIDMDRDRISGIPGSTYGGVTETDTRTKAELDRIGEGAASRIGEQKDIIEEFTEEIARKLLALMRQFYDVKRFARITGEIDAQALEIMKKKGLINGLSFNYSKEDIQGEYDIEVVAGSTLPLDNQRRLNDLLSIARFGPAFGLTPNSFASVALGKAIMRERELKDVEAAYNMDAERLLQPPPPDPEKELKVMKMKQDLERGEVDKTLKESRIMGNQLGNIKKAGDNDSMLKGEDKKKEAPKPGKKK